MTGTYNIYLVALSILVAILAGYTTLELASRTRTAPQYQYFWLIGGALAAGTGIWSMHFIGMLAFSLPIPLGYDIELTLLSWIAPVAASGAALALAQKEIVKPWQYILSPILMGGAIAAMHYIGMAAMQMSPPIQFAPGLVALSVLIAIVLSAVAIRAMRQGAAQEQRQSPWHKILVGATLGMAIAAMHYTAMWSSHFPAGAICRAADELNSDLLPGIVGTTSIVLLLGVALVAYYDRRRMEHQRLAETDALTQLKNRHFLHTRLPDIVHAAETNGTSLHLAFVDLDGFKMVNDTLGHDVGDAVLFIAARRIEECLRKNDLVIRTGGDEFIVILCDAVDTQVDNVMQRIVAALTVPMQVGADSVNISASAGVASHLAGQNSENLLIRADTAMYHAKRGGRNMWKRFSPLMDEERLAVADMHRKLHRAFERHEFLLFYQPKWDADKLGLVGVEALLRWSDPQTGMRLPGDFIAVAERTGMISKLGDWVLDEACRQISEWSKSGWQLPVSVNVSALQVRGHDITSRVAESLHKHAVDPRWLTLEITETAAVEDPLKAMDIFRSLQDSGVAISIDDFGTGYSSLAYLRSFPATELKIDKIFVRDISTNAKARELVQAIVTMGHALGMQVVAEGVENQEMVDLLKGLRCDMLQGFFLGKPMNAAGITNLMVHAA